MCDTIYRLLRYLFVILFVPLFLVGVVMVLIIGAWITLVNTNSCSSFKEEFVSAYKLIVKDFIHTYKY